MLLVSVLKLSVATAVAVVSTGGDCEAPAFAQAAGEGAHNPRYVANPAGSVTIFEFELLIPRPG